MPVFLPVQAESIRRLRGKGFLILFVLFISFLAIISPGSADAQLVSDAGPDQTIWDTDGNPGEANITLDGSVSTGPILWYEWYIIDKFGSPIWVVNDVFSPIHILSFLSDGVHTFELRLLDGMGSWDPDRVVITVMSVPEPSPAISVTPASMDFGDVDVGDNTFLSGTIENTGGGTLSGSMSGLDPPFSCIGGCGSYDLAAGATQSFSINFGPTANGSFSDTASFSEGGGASVDLTGTGFDGSFTVTPSEVDCGNQNVSDGSKFCPGFTVTNNFGSEITLNSVTVPAAFSSIFVTPPTIPLNIPNGEWRVITFQFDPVDPVSYTTDANFQFRDSGGASIGFSLRTVKGVGTAAVSCSGNITLTLTPSTADAGDTITVAAGGLSSCSGKTVSFHKNSPGDPSLTSCTISGGSCSNTFTAFAVTDQVWAKIDKDGDGSFAGSGEQTNRTLTISVAGGDPLPPPIEILDAPTGPRTGAEVVEIIKNVTNWLFFGFLLLVPIFVILAAFQYVSGGGDPAQVSSARKKLIFAAVAVIIATLAKGFVTVATSILGI